MSGWLLGDDKVVRAEPLDEEVTINTFKSTKASANWNGLDTSCLIDKMKTWTGSVHGTTRKCFANPYIRFHLDSSKQKLSTIRSSRFVWR